MYISPSLGCGSGSRTIRVPEPSGNPVIDTQNIQDAFDEASEHRGWTVKLRRGTYVINQTIEVVNFDGTFKGAGKSKTFIQTIEEGFPIYPEIGNAMLFIFYQDSNTESTASNPYTIRIEDLTIEPKGFSEPAYWGTTTYTAIEIYGVRNFEWDMPLSYFDVYIEDLEFVGQPTPGVDTGYNGYRAIYLRGEAHPDNFFVAEHIQGTFSVKDCSFSNFGYSIYFLGSLVDSNIIAKRNTFDEVLECFYCQDASNSVIKVTQNVGTNLHLDAVYITNGVQMLPWIGGADVGLSYPELSKYYICHNSFSSELLYGYDMVIITDWAYPYAELTTMKAFVYYNNLHLDDATGGGIAANYLFDSWIVGNTISGQGFMGIYFGLYADFFVPWGEAADTSSGNKILFNDVSDLTVEPLSYYLDFGYDPDSVAAIWFGPVTHDNLVVHLGDQADVNDMSGMNKVHIF